MKKKEATLRIGEIATMMGISASTLRFWEEQGLGSPEKDGKGQYRRYTGEDSSRFLTVRKYRSFGFSLSQVSALMSEGIETREDLFLDRRAELEEEIRRLNATRDALDRHHGECRLARSLIGRFERGRRPGSYCLDCIDGGALSPNPTVNMNDWLQRLPALDYTVILDPERPKEGKSFGCFWGFGISDVDAEALPEQLKRGSTHLEETPCVLTAVEREDSKDFTEEEYQALRRGLYEHGETLSGPITGHHLSFSYVDERPKNLILLFLPIKK